MILLASSVFLALTLQKMLYLPEITLASTTLGIDANSLRTS
jgi:hypothetical protein